MGIPEQKQLFSWKDVDSIGDLARLLLVLKYIPDNKLIDLLIRERDKGRNDYPVEPIWNLGISRSCLSAYKCRKLTKGITKER